MTPRLNILLLLAILLLGVPYYWFLIDNSPHNVAAKPVTVTQLRRLASAPSGPLPDAIAVERVALSRRQSNWLAAGTGIAERPASTMAFRISIPSSAPVLIDTGMDHRRSGTAALEGFDADAQRRVDRAMREAGLILATGARIDQLGGLAALADRSVADRAMLSQAQTDWAGNAPGYDWPDSLPLKPRIARSAPFAVAPGIVVIPAGSPEAANQMIYVRLAGGSEYLFTGQTAPTASSWLRQRGRPRIRTSHYLPEDRREAKAWLRTIRNLRREQPSLHIIPGVDFASAAGPKSGTGILPRFPEPSPTPQLTGKR